MKPFVPLTAAQQAKIYPRTMNRALGVSLQRIRAKHAEDLERADELEKKQVGLAAQIDKAEDRVADRADRKYKGWWVWRRDKKLLQKVATEMHEASKDLRLKREARTKKIEALRSDYIMEVDELQALHAKLLREAGCPS